MHEFPKCDFDIAFLWRCWCLVKILKLMLGRDSEDQDLCKIWTQPPGPLCFWQCFLRSVWWLVHSWNRMFYAMVQASSSPSSIISSMIMLVSMGTIPSWPRSTTAPLSAFRPRCSWAFLISPPWSAMTIYQMTQGRFSNRYTVESWEIVIPLSLSTLMELSVQCLSQIYLLQDLKYWRRKNAKACQMPTYHSIIVSICHPVSATGPWLDLSPLMLAKAW